MLPSEIERFVTLREFEQRLQTMQSHWAQNITAQRELLDVRASFLQKALELQAEEYERRLGVLNHAHEMAVKEQARVVPREMFDQKNAEQSKWRDDVNAQLTKLMPLIERVAAKDARIRALEDSNQNVLGALTFVRFMGFAGVAAAIGLLVRIVMGAQ